MHFRLFELTPMREIGEKKSTNIHEQQMNLKFVIFAENERRKQTQFHNRIVDALTHN